MSRLANDIIAQRDAGLISNWEAKRALKQLAKQAKFNADYSDTLEGYTRWTRERADAERALQHPQVHHAVELARV